MLLYKSFIFGQCSWIPILVLFISVIQSVQCASLESPQKSLHLQSVVDRPHPLRQDIAAGTKNSVVAQENESEPSSHRYLPSSWEEFDIRKEWDELLSTPIREWQWSQWLFLFVIVILMSWCCGICVRRRRIARQPGIGMYGGPPLQPTSNMPYGGMTTPYNGYSPYNNNQRTFGQQCCNCLRTACMCFMCYELCCADCHDIPCFRHSSWSGNAFTDSSYRRHEDGGVPEIV
jgi:hypothetical protein